MQKTIKAIHKTNMPEHPAVGAIYQLTFEDGASCDDTDLVYEETFYHQFPQFIPSLTQDLVGQVIDTENGYFSI